MAKHWILWRRFIGYLYGKITKRISEFQAQEKEYMSFYAGQYYPVVRFRNRNKSNILNLTHHGRKDMKTSQQFIGIIEQFPPVYSALKKDANAL